MDQKQNDQLPLKRGIRLERTIMKKIADGYYRFNETIYPTDGVTMQMQIDKIDGEELDTSVMLSGGFAISGQQRNEFAQKLGLLIDEYRI